MSDVRDRLRDTLAEYDAFDAATKSISAAIGEHIAANPELGPTPGHQDRVCAYNKARKQRILASIRIVEQARELARLLELGVIP